MKGFDQFIKFFGDITILNIAEIVLAGVFLYMVYKRVREYLIKTHDAEVQRDEQLAEALTGVRKYPEYRKQSLDIQKEFNTEIQGLKLAQKEILSKLKEMEESQERKDRNELRDKILKYYRHYANPVTNPSRSWSNVESEAFWEFFKEYEDKKGNGFVHEKVLPAMEMLTIVDIENH